MDQLLIILGEIALHVIEIRGETTVTNIEKKKMKRTKQLMLKKEKKQNNNKQPS